MTTMCPAAERFPLSPPTSPAADTAVAPFGLSLARWDPNARVDRDQVHLDPDTQVGMVGDRPLRTVITR